MRNCSRSMVLTPRYIGSRRLLDISINQPKCFQFQTDPYDCVKITILCHNLTSNAAMRAHRLALAARYFAELTLVGPVKHRGAWGALPQEPWIKPFPFKNLPKFYETALDLIAAADGDVLIAVKPYLSSYGVA